MWLAVLLSLVLGVIVSFALRYLVALSGFWLLDGTGVVQMAGWPACSSPECRCR